MREWFNPRTVIVVMAGLLFLRLALSGVHADSRGRRQVTELLDSALIALGLMFAVIRPLVAQSFFIPSGSMEPTLQVGDWVLTNRFLYRINPPRRGDVVVFRAPQRALAMSGELGHDGHTTDYIKRVVGLPGDWIEVRSGRGVYINGKRLREPYIVDQSQIPEYSRARQRVPPGQLFVMGDNRNNSNDSHAWGTLPIDRLVGKAMVIFWPPADLSWLSRGSRL
jgi:signal peptidase I